MKLFQMVNIPVYLFILFSGLVIFIPNYIYLVALAIIGLLVYKCEKFKYDEHKSMDENKKELLEYIDQISEEKYVNLNNKIQDMNTNMSKLTLGRGFTKR